MDSDIRIVRLVLNYIHNDEQLDIVENLVKNLAKNK